MLPVATLCYVEWALFVRVTRSAMLESLRQAMTGPGDPLGTMTRLRYQAAAKALGAAGLTADAPTYEEFHVPLP